MIAIRRRLIFWLFKAYLRRWGKIILIYFALGLLVFFVLRSILGFAINEITLARKSTIGIVGAYTIDDLPPSILYKISSGLTSVGDDGAPVSSIAKNWKIENNDKTYTFYLKKDIVFSDNIALTSDLINYSFSDVSIQRPDKHTIVFTLKNSYSPFLVTVSRPIFKSGFIGVGDYKIDNLKLNGNFVESIRLVAVKNPKDIISYQFYPTQDSLKTAFVLSEISKIASLEDVNFKNTNFYFFRNVSVVKSTNYHKLVTLFYNTNDKDLSSKTLRESLSYSIPDSFSQGQKSNGSFSPLSFANVPGQDLYQQDLEHAKTLLDKYKESASQSAKLSITLLTLPKYKKTAENISSIWKGIGIETDIKIVNEVPSDFQVFLGDFNLSKDPDQYPLWHSSQISNITHYNNLRIDKILEDGRQTTDIEKRKTIYADFQKYIFSDPPASFLYFPYVYEVTRK
ncbi:MAG: ABC transporter substrate-binding protein [Candidatus Levybacteria bacterium]|nr:ABC transporter substrate-binding protein [Candidatus Levybacteria bacterium]